MFRRPGDWNRKSIVPNRTTNAGASQYRQFVASVVINCHRLEHNGDNLFSTLAPMLMRGARILLIRRRTSCRRSRCEHRVTRVRGHFERPLNGVSARMGIKQCMLNQHCRSTTNPARQSQARMLHEGTLYLQNCSFNSSHNIW